MTGPFADLIIQVLASEQASPASTPTPWAEGRARPCLGPILTCAAPALTWIMR